MLRRLIATGLLIVVVACGGVRRETGPANASREMELVDEFVTGAFFGPPAEETTVERYREVAEAGLDLIIPDTAACATTESTLRVLDVAHEAGVRVLPWEPRLFPLVREAGHPLDEALIAEMTARLADHPALAGYALADEPNAAMFAQLAAVRETFAHHDPRHPALINLFPSYASAEQLGTPDYRTHVRRFIEVVRPPILSYDHYPLRVQGMASSPWFEDLALIREESRRAGIPFWIFIQSEGIEGYLRVPNRAEVLWQVGTCLAYGARGLLWFTYRTPPPPVPPPTDADGNPLHYERHHDAMLDVAGRRTPLYDHVREANHFARHAGRLLIGWDNATVAHYDGNDLLRGAAPPPCAPRAGKGSTVVGGFTNGVDWRVVIANDSHTAPAQVALAVEPAWQIGAAIAQVEAASADGSGRQDAWRLDPGGCVVIEFLRR